LYEAPAATPVSELTAALVSLYNARLRLSRLCAEGAELASYGPSRPPEQQARGGVGTRAARPFACVGLTLRCGSGPGRGAAGAAADGA